MIFEDTVKRGICSTPDLFIHPSTSASLSCTHVLQKDVEDAKTIQKKKKKQQAKGKQQIGTIPLFIKGACNLRWTQWNTREYTLGYNLVVTFCDMTKQK